MPTIVDGSLGVTYPVTAGGTSAIQASSSKVLQVVSATTTTTTTTTSSSFVATNLTASITPTSSTSKILIQVSGPIDSATINSQAVAAIFRNNATNLGSGAGMTNIFSNAGRLIGSVSTVFLDSPTTTSSTTYTLYILGTAGASIVFPQGGSTASIILTEIAA